MASTKTAPAKKAAAKAVATTTKSTTVAKAAAPRSPAVHTSSLETSSGSAGTPESEQKIAESVLPEGKVATEAEVLHALRDPNVIITSTTEGSMTGDDHRNVLHFLRKLDPFEEPQPGDQILSADPLVIVRNERIDQAVVVASAPV